MTGQPGPPLSGRTEWARSLEAPLRRFLRPESAIPPGLLAATLAGLLWINIHPSSYENLWRTRLTIGIGGFEVSQELSLWLNNGLMTFFFFVVGLEARREFDIGELRQRRRVALALLAGLRGMVVAVAIFLAANAGRAAR